MYVESGVNKRIVSGFGFSGHFLLLNFVSIFKVTFKKWEFRWWRRSGDDLLRVESLKSTWKTNEEPMGVQPFNSCRTPKSRWNFSLKSKFFSSFFPCFYWFCLLYDFTIWFFGFDMKMKFLLSTLNRFYGYGKSAVQESHTFTVGNLRGKKIEDTVWDAFR